MRKIEWEKLDVLKNFEDDEDLSMLSSGIIDLVKLASSNKFDFWIGHVNWKLTERDALILDEVIDGIESLAIISPYRFMISCARLFNATELKKSVELALCPIEFKLDESIVAEVGKIQQKLQGFLSWIIYVLPNGKIEYAYFNDNLLEYTQKCQEFQEAEQKYGGMILVPKNDGLNETG